MPGLELGKLLHDCPDLVEKNQTLTRLARRPDTGWVEMVFQWLVMAKFWQKPLCSGKLPIFTGIAKKGKKYHQTSPVRAFHKRSFQQEGCAQWHCNVKVNPTMDVYEDDHIAAD